MKQTIQLIHPAGKQAVSMDQGKYDSVKRPLLAHLTTDGACTHKELLGAIIEDFEVNRTRFDGSVEWHMEWVKLDLEAKNEIKRIPKTSPVKFALASQ